MTDDLQPASSPGAPSPKTSDGWAWPVMWIAVVLILSTAGLLVFKSCRDLPGDTVVATTQAITNISKALVDVASAFNQKTVTTSFFSYATTVSAQHYLQFATLKQTEVFTQSDHATTGFGYIPLPEVIVEARAPIEYTYVVDLNGKWEFARTNDIVHVRAPSIGFNKPAVDASKIQYEVRKGSILRNHKEAQENLKSSITFLAHRRAKENVSLVRETGRKQVTEFVEKWLARSFSDGTNFIVKVQFADEPASSPVEQTAPKLD